MENLIPFPEQLGMVLRARRRHLNLTQKTAGKRVGLLPKTISALEHAPERRSVDTLFKYLSALDLELIIRPKESETPVPAETEW
ncbi:MAG: helix-turn-helix domain-containing protein [Spirochaetales bacterium]|nr:helix-turn-helix domain-containing protein [Spirochaetales bacterium]MCF7938281.1 helix-turn-helix domain-containing protein [Spirochaetales bacterium]